MTVQLLQLVYEGELVAEAPLIVHDATKAREAVVKLMEEATFWDCRAAQMASAIMRATADPPPGDDYIVLRMEYRKRLTI